MKFDVPLLAGLLFFATQWLAQAQTQGIEVALLSSGMEYGLRAARLGSKWLRAALGTDAA